MTTTIALWSLLGWSLLGCSVESGGYELPSVLSYVAFSPDGREARIAGFAGGDYVVQDEAAGSGFDVRFTVEEGVVVDQIYIPEHYPSGRDSYAGVLVEHPAPPAGYDVSVARLDAVRLRLDAWSPNASFFVRIENTAPDESLLGGDILLSFITDGVVLDDILLY